MLCVLWPNRYRYTQNKRPIKCVVLTTINFYSYICDINLIFANLVRERVRWVLLYADGVAVAFNAIAFAVITKGSEIQHFCSMIYAEADILFLLLLFFAVVVSWFNNRFQQKSENHFWNVFFLRFLKQKKFKFLRMAETSKNFIQMYIIRSGDFQLNEWIKMQSSSFAVVCFWTQLYHLVCLFICCLSCEENSYAKQLTRLRFQLNADNFLKSSYIHKKNRTSLFFNRVKFTAKNLLCAQTSCSFVFLRFKNSRR